MNKSKTNLETTDVVIIEVNRGMVENVYTNIQNLNIYVLDKDLDVVGDDMNQYNKSLSEIAKDLIKIPV